MPHSSGQDNLSVPRESNHCPVFPDDPEANAFSAVPTSLRCEHDVDGGRREIGGLAEEKPEEFHVVPDGVDGTDTVEIFTSEYFEDVEVQSSDGEAPDLKMPPEVPVGDGEGRFRYEFDVKRPNPDLSAAEMSLAMLFKPSYWKEKVQDTRTYTVKGLDRELRIITHYPDQWEVGFKFPAARAKDVTQGNRTEATASLFGETVEDGKRLDSSVQEKFKTGTTKSDEPTATAEFKEWGEKSDRDPGSLPAETLDGTTEFFQELAGGGPPGKVEVVVKCNDRELSAEPVEFVRSLLELGHRILKIVDAMKEVPKVGWYAELTIELAQGTIAITWGWAEWEDERTFMQAGIGLELQLFNIKAEVGFGVEVIGGMVQAFAYIQGTLTLKAGPLQRSAPDLNAKVSAGIDSTLKGAIGARGKVPLVAQIEAEGSTALKLKDSEVGFDTAAKDEGSGFYLKGTLHWTGFEVRVTGSVGSNGKAGDVTQVDEGGMSSTGSVQGQTTLVEGKDLATWYFPPSREYVSNQLSPDEIQTILREVFYGGDPNPGGLGRVTSVVRRKVWPFDNVEVRDSAELGDVLPPGRVADYVADSILKRADVRRDRKAVNGMAEEIRKALRKHAKHHSIGDTFTNRISQTEFMEFLHHGELDDILDNYTY